jgi:hypothetical protein
MNAAAATRIYNPKTAKSLKLLLTVFAVASLPSTLPLLSIEPLSLRERLERIQVKLRRVLGRNIRLALFVVGLPNVFQRLESILSKVLSSRHIARNISILFTSPLVLLLPKGWRTNLTSYAVVAALAAFLQPKSKMDWRQRLPPSWTLTNLSNSWLLWAFLFMPDTFPASYEGVIVDHSRHYLSHIDELRTHIKQPGNIANATTGLSKRGHKYVACTKLHPQDPSCWSTYVKAWEEEVPRCLKWVSAFGLLSTFMSYRRGKDKRLWTAFDAWLRYTVTGTVFVVGSMSSSAAMTCALQRILPPTTLPRTRWFLNGAIGSLWILALPVKRRKQIALYTFRLALMSFWKAQKSVTGLSLKNGEVLFLAACWTSLVAQPGNIDGLVGTALRFIESGP